MIACLHSKSVSLPHMCKHRGIRWLNASYVQCPTCGCMSCRDVCRMQFTLRLLASAEVRVPRSICLTISVRSIYLSGHISKDDPWTMAEPIDNPPSPGTSSGAERQLWCRWCLDDMKGVLRLVFEALFKAEWPNGAPTNMKRGKQDQPRVWQSATSWQYPLIGLACCNAGSVETQLYYK